ncbi:peptidoglycan recognition protein family protein [Clostridium butyricum]|uniref:peptidoglycan recognition protein family protein n=1 Tax=Clostridium butyricum TaxID=1492 RepID=UPI0025A47371|nr:peptidoglycan recognition family protein [Clostridium butyricum]MDM8130090.1 peptidoglycan recognition family protein [Clostridium butyricum]MDM8228217.1 peptidoglycan recognition family protein [Clostridium butyricum]
MNIIDVGLTYGNMTYGNVPQSLIVHHIEAEGVNWTVQMIHNMHRNENGWAAIGYHYYVRLDGSIYRGRPDNAIGAHCQGSNTNTLGIAFEGNYDKRTEMPDAQYNAWCELKAYLINKYGSIPVYGHKEKGSSECPGAYFPLDKVKLGKASETTKYYVVSDYLPGAYSNYDGVDINYVLSYFTSIKCYVRGNSKGIWIETEYLSKQKCEELKNVLGSWFYEIKEE